MKKSLFASSLFLFLVSQAHAVVPLPLIYCNACAEVAKQNAALGVGLGSVYVSDVVGGTVEAYSVEIDINDATRPPTKTKIASRVPPSEPYLSTAEAAIGFYNLEPKGWNKALTLTFGGHLSGAGPADVVAAFPDRSKNVYDFIDPGSAQNALTNWSKTSVVQYINSVAAQFINLAAAFHIVDSSAVTKLVITVAFDDGSRIDIDTDFSTTNPTYKVDPNSGLDSHGNNVPATRGAATCSTGGDRGICKYDFNGPGNPTDQANWQNRMSMFGVALSGSSSSGSGKGTWACVVTGEGDDAVYTCQFVP